MWLLCLSLLYSSAAQPSFDCLANAIAFNFSLALQPFRGASFAATLADALNATACGGFAPPPLASATSYATPPPPATILIRVDPSGRAPGSVPTVASALVALRAHRRGIPGPLPATIELAPGAHRVGAAGLLLGPEDSFTTIVGPR